jgi:hypothetical protein
VCAAGRSATSATAPATAPAATSGPAPLTDADFRRRVEQIRRRIPPDRGFRIVVERPFIVVGDEPPRRLRTGGHIREVDMVRYRATHTVRWAVNLLKKDYFTRDPNEIIEIWLLKDDASYRRHAREVFGDEADTPFGYFSHRHKALIMNIRTGGGTLVHEIVHPYMRANFPGCPSWFDEGLASLYEQSQQRGGHIQGMTNWRLDGLQKAIRAGKVPSFRRLTATTTREFYEADPGTNYAQARYLCYWLQEHGLLVKFYHAFRAACEQDPTGYRTLKRIAGADDMATFQKAWEAWVLTLRFPE